MKLQIAVYHYIYLPQSETFIYRQLHGLSQLFDLKLVTRAVENEEEFPGLKAEVVPQRNLWGRLTNKERKFFDKHLYGSSLFHVNFGHIALEMQHIATRLGIPMTAYFLGVDASACLKDPFYRDKLKRSTFAAIFVNSEDMKKRLTPFLPQETKCYVAYCGIPLEKFIFRQRHTVPRGALFLQVSRLDKKKGIAVTLKAFSRYLKQTDPNARLVIGGDGPLKDELLNLSTSLGLNQNVTFLGAIRYQKYIELLQAADVFMHPSITADDGDMEGLPTAICEAMACGLPVIATRHSGIPEIIDDLENGFLAEENDVDGLYERMVQLWNVDLSAISLNARRKIELKFDHYKTISILAEYLNEIITGG
jgi:colanic acid/amylovoran biosynthesis glycosyltransferase